MPDKIYRMKDKKTVTYVAGKEGLKLYREMKKQAKFLHKTFKPVADWDDEFDFIYVAFNGGRGVKYSGETYTKEGNVIIFDFDKNDNIVGVEIEGLTWRKLKHQKEKYEELLKKYNDLMLKTRKLRNGKNKSS